MNLSPEDILAALETLEPTTLDDGVWLAIKARVEHLNKQMTHPQKDQPKLAIEQKAYTRHARLDAYEYVCSRCRENFTEQAVPGAYRRKYCKDCAQQRRREQKREQMRQRRAAERKVGSGK